LGPPLPTSQLYQDQILSLYQMRGDPSDCQDLVCGAIVTPMEGLLGW
jgi:hypothetical protein